MMLATTALAPMVFADNAIENSYISWPSYSGDDLELKVDRTGISLSGLRRRMPYG